MRNTDIKDENEDEMKHKALHIGFIKDWGGGRTGQVEPQPLILVHWLQPCFVYQTKIDFLLDKSICTSLLEFHGYFHSTVIKDD